MSILITSKGHILDPWGGPDAPALPDAPPAEKPATVPEKPDLAPSRPLRKPDPDVRPCEAPQVDPERRFTTCRV